MFEGESGSSEDKVLLMPNDEVEDLIYFHEVYCTVYVHVYDISADLQPVAAT